MSAEAGDTQRSDEMPAATKGRLVIISALLASVFVCLFITIPWMARPQESADSVAQRLGRPQFVAQAAGQVGKTITFFRLQHVEPGKAPLPDGATAWVFCDQRSSDHLSNYIRFAFTAFAPEKSYGVVYPLRGPVFIFDKNNKVVMSHDLGRVEEVGIIFPLGELIERRRN